MELLHEDAAKPDGRRSLVTQAVLLLILAGTVLVVVSANDALGDAVGRLLAEIELHRAIALLAPVCVVAAFVMFWGRSGDEVSGFEALRLRTAPVFRRIGSAVSAVPTWFLLGEIVVVSAGVRIALDRATTVPRVFGDELVYSSLAKSFAATAELSVRGTPTLDYSVLYPIAMSAAYVLAEDGVTAFATIKAVNAAFAALAAAPTYLLARMVVTRGWALLAAALAAVGPPAAYSALVMTESLFYPLLVLFVYLLALTLERPSVARQLGTLGLIAVLVAVRYQAAVLLPAVASAVFILAIAGRSVRGTLRQYVVTWTALCALGVAAASVWLVSDARSLLGAYGVLVRGYSPLDIVTWTMRHVALLELSVGVVAALALPLALFDLLRTPPLDRRRAGFAAAVGATTVWLFASVVALSASPWGLDSLHERSLFYVVPLMLAAFMYWLSAGMRRPRTLTLLVALLGVAAPLFLASDHVHDWSLDAVSLIPWAESWETLELGAVPLVRVLALVVALGAVVFLLARRPLTPVVLLVSTFVVVVGAVHRANGPIRATDELGWVDERLGDEAHVTFVHVPIRERTCRDRRAEATRKLAVYTEFFNESVTRVAFVHEPLGLDGLGFATRLEVAADGTLHDRGEPLTARYVVLDSRVRIRGRQLGRVDASSILEESGSLTLWATPGPVRLDPVPPHYRPLRC